MKKEDLAFQIVQDRSVEKWEQGPCQSVQDWQTTSASFASDQGRRDSCKNAESHGTPVQKSAWKPSQSSSCEDAKILKVVEALYDRPL